MSARYFQHLNPQYEDFQSITTLDYIDNTDPSFVLYYFKDGTKCNVDFIGKLNDTNAYDNHMEMAEISSMNNKWTFMKPEIDKTEYAVNANGEKVEMPTFAGYIGSHNTHIATLLSSPKSVNVNVSDEEFYITNRKKHAALDFNKKEAETTVAKVEKAPSAVTTDLSTRSVDLKSYLDLDTIIGNNADVYFTYNGKKYTMSKSELIAAAATPIEEKVVVKEVVKEVKKEVTDDHIEIGVDDTQKALVDNMIDMSQKEECDIDMSITLTLPPVSVYQLIKAVYPKGMDKAFVNIIADRMQIKELKMAVANGLMAYYDEDATVEISDNNTAPAPTDESTVVEPVVAETTKKKAGRPKKA